tara:strand:+ start:2651 stop:3241 length:591 start_codon:yes stop_codon:yes gene_type:complete
MLDIQSIPVTMNSLAYCSFCASAGIKGPYDHFVRASKDAGAKVVCPKLLATLCNFCGKTGHTAKFCGALQEQKMLARDSARKIQKAKQDQGEWMSAKPIRTTESNKQPMIEKKVDNYFMSRFAALEIDDESSSSSEDEAPAAQELKCSPIEEPVNTWAQIVKNRPVAQVNTEIDLDLPPLIWSRAKQQRTRWADEC